MPPPRRVAADADELDHAVAFLKTRDGLDKSLKLLRYAAMLGAFGADPRGVAGSKLRHLDRSTATARKFLRLGKFLGNARDLRLHWRARERLIEKTQSSGAVAAKVRRIEETETRAFDAHTHALRLNRLNIGCSGASLAYYFLEQFVWAKAVGLIQTPKTNTRVARLANLAELGVYVFSLQMCWGELRDARAAFDRAEKALLDARKRDDEDVHHDDEEEEEEEEEDDEDDDDARSTTFPTRALPFARRSLAAETERLSTRASLTLRGGSSSVTSSPLKNASRRAVRFLQRISRFEAFGSSFGVSTEDLEASVDEAQRRLFLARAAFLADVADCAACAGEVTGGSANPLRAPGLVGALGLVSALCGVYEKWEATRTP
mmetsp:Transcript_449/g.1721  ORF Transcript_449/g.1721 Transcript_449/m.1721 type:complete len:376 (-) Transcript_449:608-1735(-)